MESPELEAAELELAERFAGGERSESVGRAPAFEEVGVPWASFHTLRHTAASLLFARGANAVQAQRFLGHHSAAFTLATYVHLLAEDVTEPLSLDAELASAEGGNRVATSLTSPNAITQEVADADST